MLARRIGRDDRFTAPFSQPVAKHLGIVGPVGNQAFWHRRLFQQLGSARQVVGLSRGQGKRKGPAFFIRQGMNFSRPSAPRSADGLCKVPPFAPDAERWALMWVESTAVVETMPLDPLRT